jgi:hypothetical protein
LIHEIELLTKDTYNNNYFICLGTTIYNDTVSLSITK